MSILEAVREESLRLGAAVTVVHVRVGSLSGVENAALAGAFEMAREGTELTGVHLVIEESPLLIECAACGGVRAARSLTDLRCAVCGGEPAAVCSGRELEIRAVEIET